MTRGQPSPHRGEKHYCAKLTEAMVLFIRKSGEGCSRLAARFGVHKSTVHAARVKRRWKHVES
jgi:transposase